MAAQDILADNFLSYADFATAPTSLVLQSNGIHSQLQPTGGLTGLDMAAFTTPAAEPVARTIGSLMVRTIDNADSSRPLGMSSLSDFIQRGSMGISGATMFNVAQMPQAAKQGRVADAQPQTQARPEKGRAGRPPGSTKRKLSQPDGVADDLMHDVPGVDMGSLAEEAPRKKRAVIPKRERDMRARLSALEKDQLVGIICTLANKHGIHPADICGELPAVDMASIFDRLRKACDIIYKALPNTRFGSSRDDFCYKRCATHVQAFRRAVTDEGKPLVDAGMSDELIEYCLGAHDIVGMTPVWDTHARNSAREHAFKTLDRFMVTAIKGKGKRTSPAELRAIAEKIREKLATDDDGDGRFEGALAEINRRLA